MTTMPPKRIPVTARALTQRVSRALAKEDRTLRVARGRAASDLGKFIIVDHRNVVVDSTDDLVSLAKRLGVMGDFEALAD